MRCQKKVTAVLNMWLFLIGFIVLSNANAGNIFVRPLPLVYNGKPIAVNVDNNGSDSVILDIDLTGPQKESYIVGPKTLKIAPGRSGRVRIIPRMGFKPEGTETLVLKDRESKLTLAISIKSE